MTQKEIDEFLVNTKIYVNGKSKEIQEKLFSFGFEWPEHHIKVTRTNSPFLYLCKDKIITYGNDMEDFMRHRRPEITADEILSLELTEPCRPFKDKNECWQEMLNHHPFGWIKTPDGELFCIDSVFNDGIAFKHSRCKFEECLNSGYMFADGKPFGIMEL